MPPLPKPPACSGCSLELISTGYSPASGNLAGKILFLAEALGKEEAAQGDNLVGAAGAFFDRLLYRNSINRDAHLVANAIRCRPPENFLRGAPWEYSALAHCRTAYLDKGIDQWVEAGGQVLVALGALPLRQILNLPEEHAIVENWHGTVARDPSDRFWVVPTYHPSHLQRGAWNLTGVVSSDLGQAKGVAEKGWNPRPVALHVDPPVEWFAAWAKQYLLAANQNPEGVWLAVDIETPDTAGGRDEGELTAKDKSYEILRINFSCHPDEGITVPFSGAYLPIVRAVLLSPGVKWLWNWLYDWRRLIAAGYALKGKLLDGMWAWHMLQSDVPKGLGFVAPCYSDYGAWKHLSYEKPGEYAAVDAVQTLRCAFGLAKDLVNSGQWEVFERHTWELWSTAQGPATKVGLLVDKPALDVFDEKLERDRERILGEIQLGVPEGLLPLAPKLGLGEEPNPYTTEQVEKLDLVWRPIGVASRKVLREVQVCVACGAVEVSKKHSACKKDGLEPDIQVLPREVERWYRVLPFNPNSPQQILKLIKAKGLKPGKAKKDKSKETTDKDTLERLSLKDPFFGKFLLFRSVAKVQGTYVRGIKRRLVEQEAAGVLDGRIHCTLSPKPKTWRDSCTNPNLQNVIGDKSGRDNLAAGFKRCVIAAEGAELVEADFASIEAVMTGWCIQNRDFVRLARLGIHGYVAGFEVGEPANLKWEDAELGAHLQGLKKRYLDVYERCKRGVYQTLYGGTPVGLWQTYPKHFKGKGDAEKFQRLVFEVCPGLEDWHLKTRLQASKDGFLGGKAHPFRYRQWFWKVWDFRRYTGKAPVKVDGWLYVEMDGKIYKRFLGEDAKSCVASAPQGIAAGTLKEAQLRLHDPECPNFIGDMWEGTTPFRVPVHDSLLMEIMKERRGELVRKVVLEMVRPIPQLPLDPSWGMGEFLSIGVEVKVGKRNWLDMERVDTAELQAEGSGLPALYNTVAGDDTIEVDFWEGDEEDGFSEEWGAAPA